MVNYCGKFLPNIATILVSLYQLLGNEQLRRWRNSWCSPPGFSLGELAQLEGEVVLAGHGRGMWPKAEAFDTYSYQFLLTLNNTYRHNNIIANWAAYICNIVMPCTVTQLTSSQFYLIWMTVALLSTPVSVYKSTNKVGQLGWNQNCLISHPLKDVRMNSANMMVVSCGMEE